MAARPILAQRPISPFRPERLPDVARNVQRPAPCCAAKANRSDRPIAADKADTAGLIAEPLAAFRSAWSCQPAMTVAGFGSILLFARRLDQLARHPAQPTTKPGHRVTAGPNLDHQIRF